MYLFLKRLLNTSILSLALILSGFILLHFFPGFPGKQAILILVISFFVLSVAVLTLNYLGSGKPPESQMLFNLGAIGMKFLFSAIIALLYFEVFKKSGLNNILLFFVLYLTFTVFLITIIIKDLKTNTIKRDKV